MLRGAAPHKLFIGSVDGPIRRLTDDPGRDRMPVFAPGRAFAIIANNRSIYYGAMRSESDVWIVERK